MGGEVSPYSNVVDQDSVVDVCAICARELLDEFAECSDALDVIFTALVAPALKIGAAVDIHHHVTEKECRAGVKKIHSGSIRRTFSSRVLQTHFSIRANRRHSTDAHKADDDDSSMMLALANKESLTKSRLETPAKKETPEKRNTSKRQSRSEHGDLQKKMSEMKAEMARLARLIE